MTPFDLAVLDYLQGLSRGARAYAAHYSHTVQDGHPAPDEGPGNWSCTARERKQIRKAIDKIALSVEGTATCAECGHERANVEQAIVCCTMQGTPCPQCEEDAEVTRAEDAIEAGQARWSETGTTRR